MKFKKGDRVIPNEHDPYYWGSNVSAGVGLVEAVGGTNRTFIYVDFVDNDGAWPYMEHELEFAE